jgi:hypothetical protein
MLSLRTLLPENGEIPNAHVMINRSATNATLP